MIRGEKYIGHAALLVIFLFMECDDFLTIEPKGTTRFETLKSTVEGADALLIAAYSNLDGYSLPYPEWAASGSNWIFGSIAGGDAYKGGGGPDDQPLITEIETHRMDYRNVYIEAKWTTYYAGVARANDAISAFLTVQDIEETMRLQRLGEARFLRGFYHFELRKVFGNVPYLLEFNEDPRIGNKEDILPKIEEDFRYASAHLLLNQDEKGRVTKGAALSFLGICRMWAGDWSTAKIYFDSVMSSGQYKLLERFHDNFNAEVPSFDETILEVQQSVNDGSFGYNGNIGDVLNYPEFMGGGNFHQPSQDLVNAFKTDQNGLPLLDDYNLEDVTSDEEVSSSEDFTPYSGTLDPRLDWTVGRRGIPYLDWGVHQGRDWIRDPAFGGPYSPKKYSYYLAQVSTYTEASGWTTSNRNNLKLLRYADLLLYTAEAEIELENLDQARMYINMIRERAAKPEWFVMNGSNYAANYLIKPYPSFPNKEYARKAVRFERRLELAMEGHRFFDLVRWEKAAEVKNKYFENEKDKRSHLTDAVFKQGKNEVMPIPENAIKLSFKGGVQTLDQNSGY